MAINPDRWASSHPPVPAGQLLERHSRWFSLPAKAHSPEHSPSHPPSLPLSMGPLSLRGWPLFFLVSWHFLAPDSLCISPSLHVSRVSLPPLGPRSSPSFWFSCSLAPSAHGSPSFSFSSTVWPPSPAQPSRLLGAMYCLGTPSSHREELSPRSSEGPQKSPLPPLFLPLLCRAQMFRTREHPRLACCQRCSVPASPPSPSPFLSMSLPLPNSFLHPAIRTNCQL